MPKEFINPNWHVILIHYPLGVFVMGMLLEVLFLVFRYHGSVRAAARWMVVIGALSALPAAYVGLYAMSDVARRTTVSPAADDAPWHAVTRNSTLTDAQWEMIDSHAWTNGGTAVLAALIVTIGVACSDRWRSRLYPVFLVLLLGCLGTMGLGAYYGGEMVYREGVAVKLGFEESEAAAATPAATRSDSPAAEAQTEQPKGVDYYVNPVQTHLALAGLAAAMGMLGIGLSLRAASTSPHWQDPELERAGVTALPNPQRGGAEDMAVLRSFAPRVEITGEVERIPAARFWMLTFLATALTALAGWWALGDEHETYRPADLWRLVTGEGYVRRLAHVIAAGAIAAVPLGMVLLTRFARRSRGMIGLLALLLVVSLAAQAWLGALLLFDQPKVDRSATPWYRLQVPE
jgi:uncharacterized membrane protein